MNYIMPSSPYNAFLLTFVKIVPVTSFLEGKGDKLAADDIFWFDEYFLKYELFFSEKLAGENSINISYMCIQLNGRGKPAADECIFSY